MIIGAAQLSGISRQEIQITNGAYQGRTIIKNNSPNTKIGEIARFRVFRRDDQRHGNRSAAALGPAVISRPVVLTYLFEDYNSFWSRLIYHTNGLF